MYAGKERPEFVDGKNVIVGVVFVPEIFFEADERTSLSTGWDSNELELLIEPPNKGTCHNAFQMFSTNLEKVKIPSTAIIRRLERHNHQSSRRGSPRDFRLIPKHPSWRN